MVGFAKWRGPLSAILLTATVSAARCELNDRARLLGQTLRLKTPGVLGCSSLEGLKRVSALAIAQRGNVSGDQLNAEDCRLFDTLHGEVVDLKDGAVCIQGLGNFRCLWFSIDVTEPARQY